MDHEVLHATSAAGPAERTIGGTLWPQRRPSRVLSLFALGWALSALTHGLIFALDDTAWSGAVSWRKPITFSISIGLLLWTFGWVLDRLPHRRRLAGSMAWAMALASTLETGIVVFQQWRGRPSHFNTFAADDAALFAVMGTTVAVMSLLLIALFVWSLIERPRQRFERTAIWAGMTLILTGLGIGQWVLTLGLDYMNTFDAVPQTVISGEAGVPKFPHAVGFHGIQLFIAAAVLLRRAGAGRAAGTRIMRLIVAGYSGLLLAASLQAIDGRSPTDIGGPVLAVFALALLTLATGMAALGRAHSQGTGHDDPSAGTQVIAPLADTLSS